MSVLDHTFNDHNTGAGVLGSEVIQYKSHFFAFAILRLRLKRKSHPAFRVLNALYYQTDFNLRFKSKRDVCLTCKRVWCILHRTLYIYILVSVVGCVMAHRGGGGLRHGHNQNKATRSPEISRQQVQKLTPQFCLVYILDIDPHCPHLLLFF